MPRTRGRELRAGREKGASMNQGGWGQGGGPPGGPPPQGYGAQPQPQPQGYGQAQQGSPPQAPQAPQPQGFAPGGMSGQVTPEMAKGFVGALFDFSFNNYVTP